MHPHLPADAILLAGAGFLVAGLVATRLAEWLNVPAMLAFLLVGMAVGDDGLAWIHFSDVTFAQTAGVVALVVILFEGGASTASTTARSVLGPAAVMATLGVAITASIVGLAASVLFHLPRNTALLLGAIVASTDAAAVFAALRGARLQGRLAATVEVESGGNDPMAVLLTAGLLAQAHRSVGPWEWLVFGAEQLMGGLVVGAVIGWLAGSVVRRRAGLATDALPLLAVATAAGAYGCGALVGGSGFLAVYVAGLTFRHVSPPQTVSVVPFLQGLTAVAQVGLFLLLGILVFPSRLGPYAGRALLLSLVLILVARPLAVALTLPWFRYPPRQMVWVSWAGLRGAVPIVLATFPLTEGHPDGTLIFDTVFFVVLVSAALQGTTVMPLARRLRLLNPD